MHSYIECIPLLSQVTSGRLSTVVYSNVTPSSPPDLLVYKL